jgi:hypothetical protein
MRDLEWVAERIQNFAKDAELNEKLRTNRGNLELAAYYRKKKAGFLKVLDVLKQEGLA